MSGKNRSFFRARLMVLLNALLFVFALLYAMAVVFHIEFIFFPFFENTKHTETLVAIVYQLVEEFARQKDESSSRELTEKLKELEKFSNLLVEKSKDFRYGEEQSAIYSLALELENQVRKIKESVGRFITSGIFPEKEMYDYRTRLDETFFKLEKVISSKISRAYLKFSRTMLGIFFLSILAVLFTYRQFMLFEKTTLDFLLESENTKKIMEEKNGQLRAANEQLKATEHQLRASNEQLSITNRKLQAADQQLRASNQQLRASNEQLKQVNEQLRESQARFSSLFMNMVEGVALHRLVLDNSGIPRDYIIEDVNPTYEKITGISREKACGALASELYGTGRAPYLEEYSAVALEKVPRTFEVYFEPMKKYFYISVAPLEGNRFATIFMDVTERIEREERLRKAMAFESMGILAGGIAHDLNNILGPLVAYPDLLLDEVDKSSPVAEGLIAIKKAAMRATEEVSDLLALSRRGHYEKTPVSLNDVVRSFLNGPTFRKLSGDAPAVELLEKLSEPLFLIMGNEARLIKALMNLVINAYDACEKGGRVIIETRNIYLDRMEPPLLLPKGEYVMLAVEDNGSGIMPEHMDRIFEPFFTKKVMGFRSGSGLGLTIVRGVVEDHEGRIKVSSEPGAGTRFEIYFPATRLEKSEKAGEEEELSGTGSILVVDDDECQRNLMKKMLERLGYEVTLADSGEAAVKAIASQKYELVILDMIMEPGMDGLDTFKAIRALVHEQKVILASGFAETERVKEALANGALSFIKKPLTLEELGKAVKKALKYS